ncbi:hypothetical protein CgunFtcFv8_019046 [Champsocephalus gunnari]|uniref:Uncharacterized protein n=1 Tax=Champsocephalus gunnari TaxID=52237 RepID=A0AAN8DP98_CHAGU|nr:hypothetical protein CgunFtcFv8_019046 [Champsocephalus gunnari]
MHLLRAVVKPPHSTGGGSPRLTTSRGDGKEKSLSTGMLKAAFETRAVRKWPCENGRPVPPSACQEGGWLRTKEAFVEVQ